MQKNFISIKYLKIAICKKDRRVSPIPLRGLAITSGYLKALH